MKIRKGFKTVLALCLCFMMAAAFMSCGGGKTTIESLTLSPNNINLLVNTPIQFEAAGSQSNGVVANENTQVSWSSSNPSVATVNSSGLVTTLAPGTTTITISSSANITASAAFQVSPVPSPITYPVGTNPSGIAIDSNGNIWVSNYGSNNVTELCGSNTAKCPAGMSTGSVINTYTAGGTITNPSGIAIDATGNVWVPNFGSNSVTEFNSSGTLIGNFTNGVGTNPSSIVIDPTSFVWVTNQGSNTVTELSSTGNLITTYVTDITAPKGIAVGGVNFVWVTWIANMGTAAAPGNTITGINSNETLYGQFAVNKTGSSNQSEPSSIAIDPSNFLWVTNQLSNTIAQLNPGGAVVNVFQPTGINAPDAVAIDTAGSVWIANYGTTATPGTTIMQLSPTDSSLIHTLTVGNNPSAIAIDASNNIWVANYGSNTVTFLQGAATGPQFRTYITGPIWP
ncbi:MAG: Ig-like domain-containing protein [Dissulfurispiraceae bacterium]